MKERIEIIVPNMDIKKDLRKSKNELAGVVQLYCPCWFFQVKNYLKRMKLRDRVVNMSLLVDGPGGYLMLINGKLKFQDTIVYQNALMKNMIDKKEAKEKTREFITRYIFRKFSISHPIKKEFVDEKFVYRILYGVVPVDIQDKNEITLIDSLTYEKRCLHIDDEIAQSLYSRRIITENI
jgi:hypothetical protein